MKARVGAGARAADREFEGDPEREDAHERTCRVTALFDEIPSVADESRRAAHARCCASSSAAAGTTTTRGCRRAMTASACSMLTSPLPWVILAAVFFGAAASRATRRTRHRPDPERARTRKWVLFCVCLSLAVLAGSAPCSPGASASCPDADGIAATRGAAAAVGGAGGVRGRVPRHPVPQGGGDPRRRPRPRRGRRARRCSSRASARSRARPRSPSVNAITRGRTARCAWRCSPRAGTSGHGGPGGRLLRPDREGGHLRRPSGLPRREDAGTGSTA